MATCGCDRTAVQCSPEDDVAGGNDVDRRLTAYDDRRNLGACKRRHIVIGQLNTLGATGPDAGLALELARRGETSMAPPEKTIATIGPFAAALTAAISASCAAEKFVTRLQTTRRGVNNGSGDYMRSRSDSARATITPSPITVFYFQSQVRANGEYNEVRCRCCSSGSRDTRLIRRFDRRDSKNGDRRRNELRNSRERSCTQERSK